MRARLEKIPFDPARSIYVRDFTAPRFDAPWHFHPEFELTLIVASQGRRFVGDSTERFDAGDLVLLGPNLPHFWHNEGGGKRARAVVVQFSRDFLGEEVWTRPEFSAVARLLRRAARGLHFSGAGGREAAPRLIALAEAKGLAALLELLGILERLTQTPSRPLASANYAPSLNRKAEERLARVFAYLTMNFREPGNLPQIARVAAMAPGAFSRYFKRAAGRNVSVFINELRIDYAGRLLRETDSRIADIAAACGFQTLSSFNRRFREQLKCGPRQYRQAIRAGAIPAPFTTPGIPVAIY